MSGDAVERKVAALAAVQSEISSATGVPPAAESAELAGAAAARAEARRRRLVMYAGRVATSVIIVGGWQLFAAQKIVDPFFFGEPSGIVSRLWAFIVNGTAYGSIWEQIWVTLKEALLGFLVGVGGGVIFGLALGQIKFLADVLGPYIKAMNALPRIVLGSIFVISLGIGTTSKVVLAAVLVFFAVFFNVFQGVREVDRNLVSNARVLGASRWQIVRHVVLPSALTWIIASLHVAFGFAIIGAIVGEYLGAQHGLGLVITTAQNNFDIDGVFAVMLIIAVIALSAEWLIGRLERWLLGWRPPSPIETAAL